MAKELVERGQGRGFVSLQDDDDIETFRDSFSRNSDGYTTDEALDSAQRSIKLCLDNKNDPKYSGMSLLIQAPLNDMVVPRARWRMLESSLVSAAAHTLFNAVHIIGDSSTNPIHIRIK
jgi:hypothetical protein